MKEPAFREGEEAPPAGVRVMAAVRWALLALAVAAAAASVGIYAGAKPAAAQATFFCPMHVQITSSAPGSCSICFMSLEPIPVDRQVDRQNASAGNADHREAKEQVDHAGATDRVEHGGAKDHAQHHVAMAPTSSRPVADRVPVTLTEERLRAIGAMSVSVRVLPAPGGTKATATVVAPDQGAPVRARIAGYVEHLRVGGKGARVAKSQELCFIHSPPIDEAQSELLAARAAKDATKVAAGRVELQKLGLTTSEIDQVLATGKRLRGLPVLAPVSGTVATMNAALGLSVTPRVTLYEVVDASRTHLQAEVPETAVPYITEGTVAQFERKRAASGTIVARTNSESVLMRVDVISPPLDPESRTVPVRLSVESLNARLRPGDFGTVYFATPARSVLAVPRDAVIDRGSSKYVFVVEGDNRFAPRRVSTGVDLDTDLDEVEITQGLRGGESVLARAVFLVDSESALQFSGQNAAEP